MNIFTSKSRTARAAQNISLSLIIKGGSILISFLLVPITLDYLNPYEYGIWLTLNSILSWVYIFDIGLGNGLRNKLTESLANNNEGLGKKYVSTAYFGMAVIISIIFLLFCIAQNWIDWDKVLNVDSSKVSNLNSLVTILFAFFCLSFVFRLIGNVFMAKQLSFANDLLAFLGNLLALISIYACTKLFSSSLLLIGCVLAGSPLIIYLVATPFVYTKYKSIAPSIKDIGLEYFRPLLSLGVKFMIIQIASLILYMTSNLIITQLFGPQEVTPYNIAFKLFTAVTMGFSIILTPFWSAITDAYTKNDFEWIKKTTRRIIKIWLIGFAGTIILLVISPIIYRVWIGDKINISMSLSSMCALYVTLTNWNNIWAYIINGTGKLLISLLLAIVQALLYIPLAILFGKSFGIIGVVLALCTCMMVSGFVAPIQYHKLIYLKSKGLWIK